MTSRRPNSNVREDIPIVPRRRRVPTKTSPPARISRSPGLFASQSPSKTRLPDDQAPSTGVRRAVAVEPTPAPPGILDRYVDIKGSDIVLEVLREVQVEGGIGFQV